MEKRKVRIDQIVVDEQVQQRENLNETIISEYADEVKSANEADRCFFFPPLEVFDDGERFILAEGFHRIAAYKEVGVNEVELIIHEGDKRAATLHAAGANASHGLRRTNADKRKAVTTLLKDDEWRSRSDRWIADCCRVSQPFVSKLRGELSENGFQSESQRVGRDGRTIQTANIGTKPEGADVPKDEAGGTCPDESAGGEVPDEDNPVDEGQEPDAEASEGLKSDPNGGDDDEQDEEPSDEAEPEVSSDQGQTPPEVQPEIAEESDETGEEPGQDNGDDDKAGDPGEPEADADDEPEAEAIEGPKVTAEEVRTLEQTISDLRACLDERDRQIAELEAQKRDLEKKVAYLKDELARTAEVGMDASYEDGPGLEEHQYTD